jgi:hypothetical protein
VRSFYILDKAEGIFGFSRPNPPRLIAMLVLAPGRSGSAHFMCIYSVSTHSQWIVSCLLEKIGQFLMKIIFLN